ncbi:right-handed parallel beta-helix repeat-containing protein [Azospirillum sp. sgz301742]
MADIYVSTNGSDSNSGTKNLPYRTIQQASSEARAGTTVHVAPGTYEGGFTTTTDGVTYVSDVKWGAKITSGDGDVAWENKGANVTINGFEVDGSKANWRIGILTDGSNSTVKNSKVHDIANNPDTAGSSNGGAGIFGDGYNGGTNISMDGNEVFNIGPAGQNSSLIHGIYQGTSGTIDNNKIHDNAGVGIHLWHDAHDVDILDNTVTGSNMGIWVGSGDSYGYSSTADGVKVAGNDIHNNRSTGVAEGGSTGTDNVYTGNSVHDNGTNWSLQNGLKPQNAAAAAQAFTDAMILPDQTPREDTWEALVNKV